MSYRTQRFNEYLFLERRRERLVDAANLISVAILQIENASCELTKVVEELKEVQKTINMYF